VLRVGRRWALAEVLRQSGTLGRRLADGHPTCGRPYRDEDRENLGGSATTGPGEQLGDSAGQRLATRARGKTCDDVEWGDRRRRLAQRRPRPVDELAYRSFLRAELGGDLLMAAPFQFAKKDRVTLARGERLDRRHDFAQSLTPLENLFGALLFGALG